MVSGPQGYLARTERRCVRVFQRQVDSTTQETLHALENVISLIVGREQGYRFGYYKQWEADFLRFMLGYTTLEEEGIFNEQCQLNNACCAQHNSLQMRMGKKFPALLRHQSPLKDEMYPNGAVDLHRFYDHLSNSSNPTRQFQEGRQFAAFIEGNNKQRYFIELYLNENWNLNKEQVPWKIYIGCTQGHSTGVVQVAESAHKLSVVQMYCLGWIFHVTDEKYERSIREQGLRRYKRDTLHFLYDNDNSDGCIRKGPGTEPPRQYDST